MLRSTGVQVPPGQTPPNSTVRTPQLGERTTHSESARSRLREALRSGTSGFVTGYPPRKDTSTVRTPQLGERTTHSGECSVSAPGSPAVGDLRVCYRIPTFTEQPGFVRGGYFDVENAAARGAYDSLGECPSLGIREALRSGTSGFVTGYPPLRNSSPALSAEDFNSRGRGCRMLRSTGVQVPPGQTPPNKSSQAPGVSLN